jgi:hypothetical protein
MEVQDLNDISCLGVSTDYSSHGSLKLFSVVVQYFYKVYGTESKLIDLNSTPNEKSEMIVNCVTQTLKDHGTLQSVLQSLVTTQTLILEEIKMSSML